MENRIKERLTGALILVALLVILVPELLSGRVSRGGGGAVPDARPASEGPPLRSYRMDLDAPADPAAGQAALNVHAAPEVAALPAPAAAGLPPPAAAPAATPPAQPPAPTSPSKAPAQVPAAQSLELQPKAAPERSVVPPAAGPAASAKGSWYVQVGSFAKRDNAQRYVQELGRKGYAARVLGGGALFRVRVGPVADRAAAGALQGRLAADGFKGAVAGP